MCHDFKMVGKGSHHHLNDSTVVIDLDQEPIALGSKLMFSLLYALAIDQPAGNEATDTKIQFH